MATPPLILLYKNTIRIVSANTVRPTVLYLNYSNAKNGKEKDEELSHGGQGGRGSTEIYKSLGKEIEVVTSSLRVDAVAAIGLNISRKAIWELSLNGMIYLNGSRILKKSTKVKETDVIEVDRVIDGSIDTRTTNESPQQSETIKRGRVVVKEIGPRTRKGKYRVILTRYKHFKIYNKE